MHALSTFFSNVIPLSVNNKIVRQKKREDCSRNPPVFFALAQRLTARIQVRFFRQFMPRRDLFFKFTKRMVNFIG